MTCYKSGLAAFSGRPGVRAAAMGYASTASAADAYAVYWNPALLPRLNAMEVAGEYNKWMYQLLNNDLQNNYISVVLPGHTWGTCGVSYGAFNSAHYFEQQYGFHYGVALLHDRLYWGFGVQGLDLGYRLDSYTAEDPFFARYGQRTRQINSNMGMALELNSHFRLALALQNLNRPNTALQRDQDVHLPLQGIVGVSAQWSSMLLTADAEWSDDGQNAAKVRFGGEWRAADPLHIQFGYGDRFVSGGLTLTSLVWLWEDRSFAEAYSSYFTTTTTLQVILEYAVRYPVSGIDSDYGNQYFGFRLTLGKKRAKEWVKSDDYSDASLPATAKRISRVSSHFSRSRIQNTPSKRQIDLSSEPDTDDADAQRQGSLAARSDSLKENDKVDLENGVNLAAVLAPLRTLYNDDYELMEKTLRKVVSERPNAANGHLYLAIVLVKLERIEEAMTSFQTACQLDPTLVAYEPYFK
jgi:tetratricopeptide (TPR) repeat protein